MSNDILKLIRKETLPLLDQTIKDLGGTPPRFNPVANAGGRRLAMQIRNELNERIKIAADLAATKSGPVARAPVASKPPVATSKRKTEIKPEVKTDGGSKP